MDNNLTPKNTQQKDTIFDNKGTLVAVALVIIALSFGVIALFNMGSSSEYQGMIKKVEEQTQKLAN